jgi:FkbM family methyltransferase
MIISIVVGELRKLSSILRNLLKPKTSVLPGILEKKRIEYQPRKKVFSTYLLNKKILISDSYWYLPTLDEIWGNQIYKFHANSETPFIIDCGANIGLSVIYWKYLYPESRIIAFEPDPEIFKLLQHNVEVFNFDDIDLRPYAVWSSNTILNFQPDNSVGGRLADDGNNLKLVEVNTFRLSNILDKNIDMLKIDIEGAETEVLMDCKDKLASVDKLFVEYHGYANETQTLHEILLILINSGFRYHIKEANPIKHPFIASERGKFYDLQLNVYAFRN